MTWLLPNPCTATSAAAVPDLGDMQICISRRWRVAS